MSGMLEGKVVVVTGAGRGVGRGAALMAANAGASVVVNDLGVSPGGEDTGEAPAASVVREIRDAGGQAVANTEDVGGWKSASAIIECAIDTFGRVDAVVNNAGILQDAIFHKMEPESFERVLQVNLAGPFYLSRAAAPHFKDQGAGAYVHMTSSAALIGNMGQANYMASKMGLVGLSTSISIDMQKFGVTSNCIAPFAWTRMVGTIPVNSPEQQARVEGLKKLDPNKVGTLAVALISDAGRAAANGQVFGVRNNEIYLFSKNRPIQIMHDGDGWTCDAIIDRVMPAFEPNFLPPAMSRDIFSWDPV
ncbi:MAG: SDR family NAD(P)-dependent oxidoreductase [Parvibaculaceae bacterium]